MAAVVVGDIVAVTVAGTLCGQRTLNSFPYRLEIAPTETNYDLFAAALNDEITKDDGLYERLRAVLPNNWNLNAIWVQVIRPVRLRKIAFPLVSGGNSGATALTPNIQASITRVGDQANRKNIGGIRISIAGAAAESENGLLKPLFKASLADVAERMEETLFNAANLGTLVPLVGVPKTGIVTADLVDAFPQDTTRVIRRRTVGLGI